MRRPYCILAVLFTVLAAGPARGAGTFSIDAPGGWSYEKDGAISAFGAKGKQVVVVLGEHYITADAFYYHERKQTGKAVGSVYWIQRRAEGEREIRAGAIVFALAPKTLRAEGNVALREGELGFTGESAQVDLAKGLYQLDGHPARLVHPSHTVAGAVLRYDSLQALVAADGQVSWRFTAKGETRDVTADRFTYDLSAHRGEASGKVRAGIGAYELSAARLVYEESPDRYLLSGEPAGVRQEQAKRIITARTIEMTMDARKLRAEGEVCIKDGETELTAETAQADLDRDCYDAVGHPARLRYGLHLVTAGRVSYNRSEGAIVAEAGVAWETKSGEAVRVVAAERLVYNLPARRAEAAGGVRIEADEYRLSAERLIFAEDEDSYSLNGQPEAVRGELRLRADNITCRVTEGLVVAAGGASFTGRAITGTGEEIRYAAKENRVYLRGAARLVRGQDAVAGVEIVCDLETGQIKVAGPVKASISL